MDRKNPFKKQSKFTIVYLVDVAGAGKAKRADDGEEENGGKEVHLERKRLVDDVVRGVESGEIASFVV